jgi:hypothetical protein
LFVLFCFGEEERGGGGVDERVRVCVWGNDTKAKRKIRNCSDPSTVKHHPKANQGLDFNSLHAT